MRVNLHQALLGVSLLVVIGCSGGGNSKAPTIVTGAASIPTGAMAVFDPAGGAVPLPNILATASYTSVTYTATATPAAGTLNINPNVPLTPDKWLAYINLKEMGSTHAVSGLNSPIFIQFSSAVDPATVNGSNIKVFQLTPDAAGTENAALGFTDVSGLFTYSTFTLTPSGMGVYALPKLPLIPGTRYLYVVTNRVLDATTGLPVRCSDTFTLMKSTASLGAGSFATLEAIRADLKSGSNILLSGYAKVMNDLITASATTTVTSRNDIALMGRFITTGAGYIPADPIGTPTSRMPVETALWAYANNKDLSATSLKANFASAEARQWNNNVSNFQLLGTSAIASGAGSLAAIFGTIPYSSVGFVGAGTFESADFQLDPYTVNANLANAGGKLDAVTGVYNPGTSTVPGTGVLQAFRNATGVLRGFYHQTRTVPFVIISPKNPSATATYPVAVFLHGISGQKEHVLGLANTICASGYVVVAIDQALHGLPANGQKDVTGATVSGSLTSPAYTGVGMGNGRPQAEWASNFFSLPNMLVARTNAQTSAFNLWRLEKVLATAATGSYAAGTPGTLQDAMINVAGVTLKPAGATHYIGHSLGSMVGALFLAGNSAQTGGSNMKALLAVPGGRAAWILKDSQSAQIGGAANAGLTAAGYPPGSAGYYQYFLLAQSVLDAGDMASMALPLTGSPTSRLAGRVVVQEAVGDTTIPNASCGQYFVNALAGRQGQLGVDISGGFTQVLKSGQTAATVPYVYGATLATTKTPMAAALAASSTNPTQGVYQYGTVAVPASHGIPLSDPTTPANVVAAQHQIAIWLAAGVVADGADATNGYPVANWSDLLSPMALPGLPLGPESMTISYPRIPQN